MRQTLCGNNTRWSVTDLSILNCERVRILHVRVVDVCVRDGFLRKLKLQLWGEPWEATTSALSPRVRPFRARIKQLYQKSTNDEQSLSFRVCLMYYNVPCAIADSREFKYVYINVGSWMGKKSRCKYLMYWWGLVKCQTTFHFVEGNWYLTYKVVL